MSFAVLWLSVLVGAACAATPDVVDPTTQATLDTAFAAPDAKWVPVEQRFWPDYRVFKQRSSSWYHRPTLALGPDGQAHVLTDNVLRISAERTLAEINRITLAQAVRITSQNLQEFADFFLRAHLLYADDACLSPSLPDLRDSDTALPASACAAPSPFTGLPQDDGFVVQTFLVHRRARTAWPKRYAIAADGTITSIR